MQFAKLQGTGNDFVLVDGRQFEADWAQLALAVCDRHFGIGADGLLVVLPSSSADIRMRIFNPDASEAEMCGNGIRCLVRWLWEQGDLPVRQADLPREQEAVRVETKAGLRTVRLVRRGEEIAGLQVEMGVPEFRPAAIPVALEGDGPVLNYPLSVDGQALQLTFVSLGNPHAVAFIETPVADFPLERLGPLVEHHPLFPARINFEIARALGPGRFEARVWERGAGLTLACGTGASAVAAAAHKQGIGRDEIDIRLPGGALRLAWDGVGQVLMTGPADLVFYGTWPGRIPA
jgi:diaminopimelate epimerase